MPVNVAHRRRRRVARLPSLCVCSAVGVKIDRGRVPPSGDPPRDRRCPPTIINGPCVAVRRRRTVAGSRQFHRVQLEVLEYNRKSDELLRRSEMFFRVPAGGGPGQDRSRRPLRPLWPHFRNWPHGLGVLPGVQCVQIAFYSSPFPANTPPGLAAAECGFNPIRWADYSLSASLMIIVLSAICGVSEGYTLVLVALLQCSLLLVRRRRVSSKWRCL